MLKKPATWTRPAATLSAHCASSRRDPQLLQHMAEIKLQKEDCQQALNFASRSYDIGPRVGEICSRNWRTISVAKEPPQ